MARRAAAERPAGGGDGIQALRKARARLTLALASAAAYAGVTEYSIARSGELGGAVLALASIGGVLLLLTLWKGWLELLVWAIATGGAAYTATLFVDYHGADGAAPLVAAALLLTGELAAWSLDARWRVGAEAAVLRRRALALGALVVAGLAASAMVVALSGVDAGGGLLLTTLGAASAVCAVGISVVLLARGR
ncbi:MAG TPA: hypothetical protein VHD91_11810 [Gaiellaceae bacterium]|nr:hypothetical protein [Gaiellaceae bacterium]